MHIYISTGDTSGEQHAGALVRACKERHPDWTFSGMGTSLLAQAGVDIAIDSSDIKVMGFVAIIRHLPAIVKSFYRVLNYIETKKPDAVVLVDYPGFHMRLAKAIKKRHPNLPVIYNIMPQVWGWHTSRVHAIRKNTDHCLCILPFEPEWFAQHDVEAEYVGNPVRDSIAGADGSRIRKLLGLKEHTRLISIFPGSRPKELHYILPAFIDAAQRLEQDFDDIAIAIAAAHGYTHADLDQIHPIPSHYPVLEGHNHDLLAASALCLAKSGTTTLEAALLGCPMLVAYKGDWLSAKIAFRLMQVPYISLPNIIAQRAIVPEFLQDLCNGPELARNARILLKDPEIYDTMLEDLSQVRTTIGDIPAPQQAADALSKYLESK